MKHGGSSRRRQKMAQRDVEERQPDANLDIQPGPISKEPSTEEVMPMKPVYDQNTGQLGTTDIEREPERPGEVSTTAVGVGTDNDEIPTVTNAEEDSSEIGADLKVGTTGKIAAAALAGGIAFNLLS